MCSSDLSDHTSAQKRSRDLQANAIAAIIESAAAQAAPTATEIRTESTQPTPTRPDYARHLSPIDLQESTKTPGPDLHVAGDRCSNKGFLPMSTEKYLKLLDWTASQIVYNRHDKTEPTPPEVDPFLNQLGLNESTWCALVRDFGRLFSQIGRAHV